VRCTGRVCEGRMGAEHPCAVSSGPAAGEGSRMRSNVEAPPSLCGRPMVLHVLGRPGELTWTAWSCSWAPAEWVTKPSSSAPPRGWNRIVEQATQRGTVTRRRRLTGSRRATRRAEREVPPVLPRGDTPRLLRATTASLRPNPRSTDAGWRRCHRPDSRAHRLAVVRARPRVGPERRGRRTGTGPGRHDRRLLGRSARAAADGDAHHRSRAGWPARQFDLHPSGARSTRVWSPTRRVPDDDDHRHVELGQGVEHVEHHRAPAQVMEGLRTVGAHPGPSPAARTTADSARCSCAILPSQTPVPSQPVASFDYDEFGFFHETRGVGLAYPVLRWCPGGRSSGARAA